MATINLSFEWGRELVTDQLYIGVDPMAEFPWDSPCFGFSDVCCVCSCQYTRLQSNQNKRVEIKLTQHITFAVLHPSFSTHVTRDSQKKNRAALSTVLGSVKAVNYDEPLALVDGKRYSMKDCAHGGKVKIVLINSIDIKAEGCGICQLSMVSFMKLGFENLQSYPRPHLSRECLFRSAAKRASCLQNLVRSRQEVR